MTDLMTAAQDAVFAALSHASVTSLAPVHQHVPDGTQPPIVIVGDMKAEAAGGKDGGLDRIDFEILYFVREPRRAALFALMAGGRARLDDQALPEQAGVALSRPAFVGSDDDLLDDGQTYFGVQRYSLFAQPD